MTSSLIGRFFVLAALLAWLGANYHDVWLAAANVEHHHVHFHDHDHDHGHGRHHDHHPLPFSENDGEDDPDSDSLPLPAFHSIPALLNKATFAPQGAGGNSVFHPSIEWAGDASFQGLDRAGPRSDYVPISILKASALLARSFQPNAPPFLA